MTKRINNNEEYQETDFDTVNPTAYAPSRTPKGMYGYQSDHYARNSDGSLVTSDQIAAQAKAKAQKIGTTWTLEQTSERLAIYTKWVVSLPSATSKLKASLEFRKQNGWGKNELDIARQIYGL